MTFCIFSGLTTTKSCFVIWNWVLEVNSAVCYPYAMKCQRARVENGDFGDGINSFCIMRCTQVLGGQWRQCQGRIQNNCSQESLC